MNKLKISIIIASLNSEKTIVKAISSIENQNYNNLEVVFVDGGSTDNTVNLIGTHNLPDVKIISEPDRGIGDAWNKGLRLCSGDIIGILNSDDAYDENIFDAIGDYFLGVNGPLIGFGNVILINVENGGTQLFCGAERSKLGLLNGFGFLHPSVFFNRQALEQVGLFNSRIRVAVDTDWLLRAVTLKIAFKKIPSLAYMRSGGVSDVNRYTGMGEFADALIRNGYSDLHLLLFFMLRFLGKLRRVMSWKKVR